MLHVINGDSTAATLKQSAIPGEKLSFRDALISGPAPAGVDGAEWRRFRAQHLSEAYGDAFEVCEKLLLEQDETLNDLSGHEEVVLWFEYDLFCQLNLLYLLHRFAHSSLGKTRLSLINIGSFPGRKNFRGLGELSVEELASLFPSRQPVGSAELRMAASAWDAYCSPDPSAIERVRASDTSALPFLATAFHAHLRRFPSVTNGLGSIENTGLNLIESGFHEFNQVFAKFGELEGVYGLGDFQFWNNLKQLAHVPEPLLSFEGNGNGRNGISPPQAINFDLTDTGRAVLRGDTDFVHLNGLDCWLGGVHLSAFAHNIWRWDNSSQRLLRE